MKTVAFVGNPNAGKTAWINALSDAGFEVGNWPGVTVERKQAQVEWDKEAITLIDLPGIYDLQKTNNEEQITQDFLGIPANRLSDQRPGRDAFTAGAAADAEIKDAADSDDSDF